jgi:peptide chain release factor 2
MGGADFWNNQEAAQKVVAELKSVKSVVESFRGPPHGPRGRDRLLEMSDDVKDAEHIKEVAGKLPDLQRRVEATEVQALFTGPNDARDVFVSIHPGRRRRRRADWAQILERMYQRWFARNGYQAEVVDREDAKRPASAASCFDVKGRFAFGYLKSEIGVHRLIRISPFDANHRRQTSFASVDVVPQYEDVDVEINEADLRIDTYSAGGPGRPAREQDPERSPHHPPPDGRRGPVPEPAVADHEPQVVRCARWPRSSTSSRRPSATPEYAKMYGEKGEISFSRQDRSYTMQPYTLGEGRAARATRRQHPGRSSTARSTRSSSRSCAGRAASTNC